MDKEELCPACNGTGEGPVDGYPCRVCLGTGEYRDVDAEEDRNAEAADHWYDARILGEKG
jgi:RecJ-like exonuclease